MPLSETFDVKSPGLRKNMKWQDGRLNLKFGFADFQGELLPIGAQESLTKRRILLGENIKSRCLESHVIGRNDIFMGT